MKRVITTLIIAISALFYMGCPSEKHRTIVFVVDMSASTDSIGRASAFQAVSGWFAQKQLRRGDRLVVIPITGDAWTESQGLVQRFRISEKREVYDADIRRLEEQVKQQLEKMEQASAESPYKNTDIFGALRLAAEELAHDGPDIERTVVILSDLIQDDTAGNFKVAAFMKDRDAAIDQARNDASEQSYNFEDCTIFLGLLRSTELKSLSHSRRESLEAYWIEYFRQRKASRIVTAIDGPGHVGLLFNENP